MIRRWDAMSEITLLLQLRNNIKVLHVYVVHSFMYVCKAFDITRVIKNVVP